MNEKFKKEYLKFTGKKYEASFRDFIRIWSSHTMKFLYYGRLSEFAKSSILKKYYLFMLCHGYGVTVNENAILGDDVTLFKGCTVGGVRSGKLAGTPTIGNRVVLCVNSTVVGKVTIGDDVMIAPNAYVNFDVPPNSVVIGNPGVIHHKDHAADDYFTAFAVRNRCGLDL